MRQQFIECATKAEEIIYSHQYLKTMLTHDTQIFIISGNESWKGEIIEYKGERTLEALEIKLEEEKSKGRKWAKVAYFDYVAERFVTLLD